jgi:hypothetical protein
MRDLRPDCDSVMWALVALPSLAQLPKNPKSLNPGAVRMTQWGGANPAQWHKGLL